MIYGVSYDLAPYATFLHSRGIEILEDCAQSWQGLDSFRGSPVAVMTMFSFGTIKHNTCFYGAVTIVRENAQYQQLSESRDLCKQMRALQDAYPVYSYEDYRSKILKCMLIKRLVTGKYFVSASLKYFAWRQIDFEDYLISKIRGFATDPSNYLSKFRIQPNAPLLKMIYEKQRNYDKKIHAQRIRNFKRMTSALQEAGYFVPGSGAPATRSYWLYPFPVQNKL